MRVLRGFFVLILSAALSQAAVTSRADVPTCAIECFQNATTSSSCSINDTCLCQNSSIHKTITECTSKECTVKETFTTLNLVFRSCKKHTHKRTEFMVTAYTLGALSTLIVALRLSFKFYSRLDIGNDDWTILATSIVNIFFSIIIAHGLVSNGLGEDIWNVPHNNIYSFGKYYFIEAILYFIESSVIKLTFLFFYLRIFPAKKMKLMIWATFAVTSVYGLVFTIISIFFQCKPISYFWSDWDGEHHGKCMDRNAMAWSHAAIGIALDVWVFVIPFLQLKTLKMHWKKKIGVALMFCVGAFATVVSILRLQSLIEPGFSSTNPTQENCAVLKWSIIEINVGIVCNCMPTLRLILVRLFPRFASSNQQYAVMPERNDSRKYANGSMRLGNSAVVQASGPSYEMKKPGIACQSAYTVEFAESDEVQLVHGH